MGSQDPPAHPPPNTPDAAIAKGWKQVDFGGAGDCLFRAAGAFLEYAEGLIPLPTTRPRAGPCCAKTVFNMFASIPNDSPISGIQNLMVLGHKRLNPGWNRLEIIGNEEDSGLSTWLIRELSFCPRSVLVPSQDWTKSDQFVLDQPCTASVRH